MWHLLSEHPVPQGLASAMRFVRAAREEPALTAQLGELDPEDGLEPVLRLAARAGFDFHADDLRAAHRIDWGLRRARYARGS